MSIRKVDWSDFINGCVQIQCLGIHDAIILLEFCKLHNINNMGVQPEDYKECSYWFISHRKYLVTTTCEEEFCPYPQNTHSVDSYCRTHKLEV